MISIHRIKRVGLLSLCFIGCRRAVEVPPPITQLVSTSVYSTNVGAAAAVSGIYITMANNAPIGGGYYGISALAGLSADEFTLYPGADLLLNQYYTNAILSTSYSPIWQNLYNYIYQANSAIEGVFLSNGVTPALKQQLLGEAKFIRAFCHFYLVSFYGNVPIVTSTDYRVNALISPSPPTQVYQQIIIDLKDAQAALSDNFLAPDGSITTERVRPNKGAATALLSRTYLYAGKYDSAVMESTAVINNHNYTLLDNLDSVFLANNTEAIWQLELPNNTINTLDGSIFLLSNFGGPTASYPFILRDSLMNNFEAGDLRRLHWTDSMIVDAKTYYFPFKYKLFYTGQPPTEYPVLFRLAEQYLIRAEGNAQLGNIAEAQADVDSIRARAGLANTTANDQPSLLAAIQKERRFEFFTEYGHRWLDLKRAGNVDAIMNLITSKKGGGAWVTTDQLYPIPLSDIKADVNLTQNPGYN